MKLIAMLITFAACNPMMWKAAEDGIEGEIQVAETVMGDLTAAPQSPGVTVPIKKF
jgi:hypothetical protein